MNSASTTVMNIVRPIIIESEHICKTINDSNVDIVSGKKRNIQLVVRNDTTPVKKPRYK